MSFIVSYYRLDGHVQNVSSDEQGRPLQWADAKRIATRKAIRNDASPVIICTEDGTFIEEVRHK